MRERLAEHFENRLETPKEIRGKLKNSEYLPSIEEIKKDVMPFLLIFY